LNAAYIAVGFSQCSKAKLSSFKPTSLPLASAKFQKQRKNAAKAFSCSYCLKCWINQPALPLASANGSKALQNEGL
jgi:hypothetical protein